MKKILSICLVAMLALVLFALPVCAESDVPYAYVTIVDENGKIVLASQYVTLPEFDMSIDAVLAEAHRVYADEAHGYTSVDSQWGRSMTKLWGVENGGSYGYYVNNASPSSLLDPVKTGDHIYAFVYTDTMNFSDTFSYFDEHHLYNLEKGDEVTLTLMKMSFDENWMPVSLPVADAIITVNGKATEVKTDDSGKATIALDDAGELVISAVKEGENLTPAVCVANVNGLSNAMIYTMLGVVAFIIVLVLGVVIGIIFYVTKVSGKNKDEE